MCVPAPYPLSFSFVDPRVFFLSLARFFSFFICPSAIQRSSPYAHLITSAQRVTLNLSTLMKADNGSRVFEDASWNVLVSKAFVDKLRAVKQEEREPILRAVLKLADGSWRKVKQDPVTRLVTDPRIRLVAVLRMSCFLYAISPYSSLT